MSLWIFVIPILLLVAFLPSSEAITNNQHIGIVISDTCKKLILSNSTTNCPTYEDILLLFEDTSDKTRSGDFDYNEQGFYERQPAQMKNHREYYRYTAGTQYTDEKNIYWVDPPADLLLSGAKKIIIEAGNFWYAIDQVVNSSRIDIGNNRYVSSTCSYSIITASNWIFLLGDTMQYMKHDCHWNYTNFHDNFTYYWDATQHNIENTAKWQYEQLIKNTKETCSVRCNEYETVGQNFTEIIIVINNTENYQVSFNESMQFVDEMFGDHVVAEPDPCQKAGPLCDYYRYQQRDHVPASSSFVKLRNDIAGAINEN